jgi:hypothetical protein
VPSCRENKIEIPGAHSQPPNRKLTPAPKMSNNAELPIYNKYKSEIEELLQQQQQSRAASSKLYRILTVFWPLGLQTRYHTIQLTDCAAIHWMLNQECDPRTVCEVMQKYIEIERSYN